MEKDNGHWPGLNTPVPDAKQLATLRARFALQGRELREISRRGQVHYEVRWQGQMRTCSTLHDLEGILAALGGRR